MFINNALTVELFGDQVRKWHKIAPTLLWPVLRAGARISSVWPRNTSQE